MKIRKMAGRRARSVRFNHKTVRFGALTGQTVHIHQAKGRNIHTGIQAHVFLLQLILFNEFLHNKLK